jgi:hypothetical protein
MYGAAVDATAFEEANRQNWTINHEAGHAVMYWIRTGRAPKEIDAYYPETGVAGCVVMDHFDFEVPDDADLRYVLERLDKNRAMCARAGAMAARQSWDDPGCASDRAKFESACRDLPGGEVLIEDEVRDEVGKPRFKALYTALALALKWKEGAIDRVMREPEIRACLEAVDRECGGAEG